MNSKRYRDIFEKKLDDWLIPGLSFAHVSLTNEFVILYGCFFINKTIDGYRFINWNGYETYRIKYNNGFYLESDKFRCVTNRIGAEVNRQYVMEIDYCGVDDVNKMIICYL